MKKLLPHQQDWVDSTDFVVLKFAVVTILVADWGVAHPVAVAHAAPLVHAGHGLVGHGHHIILTHV